MSTQWFNSCAICGVAFSGSDAVGSFYAPAGAWYYFNTTFWNLISANSGIHCCSKYSINWSGTYSGGGTAVLNVANIDANWLDGCTGASLGAIVTHNVAPGVFNYTFPDLYAAGPTRTLIYANNALTALNFVSTVVITGTNNGMGA
jgi:hypothetical protein